jgi:hypothetical protein
VLFGGQEFSARSGAADSQHDMGTELRSADAHCAIRQICCACVCGHVMEQQQARAVPSVPTSAQAVPVQGRGFNPASS